MRYRKHQTWRYGVLMVMLVLTLFLPQTAQAMALYTVTYDANGGDPATVPIDTYAYQPGSTVNVLEQGNLTNSGYDFIAWNTAADASGTYYLAPSTFTINEPTTLYALWALHTYNVYFDTQGGTDVPVITDLVYGSTISQPETPEKHLATFAGWYKEPVCINTWEFTTDTVTADTTLYAKWAPRSYTITYNSQGGSAVASSTVNHGYIISQPTAPTRAGFSFSGWYKEAECTTAWDFSTTTVAGDITLYAKWIAEVGVNNDSNSNDDSSSSDSNVPHNPNLPGAVFSDQRAVGVNKPAVKVQEDLQKAGIRDVNASDWYAGSVSVLVEAGLLKPDADGNFHPMAQLNTGDGVAVFAKVLGIAAKNDTAAEALRKAQEAGLVDSGVSIDQDMSRVDTARLLAKALGIEPKIVLSPTEYPFQDFEQTTPADRGLLKALYDLGIFKGYEDRTFRPNDVLTRVQIAILVDRILGAH